MGGMSSNELPVLEPYLFGHPLAPEWKGKCSWCGFMWIGLSKFGAPLYEEVDEFRRVGVSSFLKTDDGKDRAIPRIECLMSFRDLSGDIAEEATRQQGNWQRAATKVLSEDPKCPYWQMYRSAKPISQYYMESFMERLEELRQRFQRDGEERQRVWEAKLSESQARLQDQTNRIVEAILATTKDHKQITEESKDIATNSLAIVAESKKIAEGSLTTVAEINTLAKEIGAASKLSNKFNRKVNLWLIGLTILILLLTAIQVYFAVASKPPTVIMQQPSQQQPIEPPPKQNDGSSK
jgi:hypothetical protein